MTAVNDDRVRAKVEVQISPTFWGWLFQFVEKMTVLGPEEVKEEYKKRAEAVLE